MRPVVSPLMKPQLKVATPRHAGISAMDIATARTVLGVSDHASVDQISSRFRTLAKVYHPDIPNTGDHKRFLEIAIAFFVLKDASHGRDHHNDKVIDDISYAINLRSEINAYIDVMVSDFTNDIKFISRRTDEYVRQTIYSAKSGDEIRRHVNNRISKYLTDVSVEIQTLMADMSKKMSESDSDFIFHLFSEHYKGRRKRWLFGLYRNPITLLEIMGQLTIFAIRQHVDAFSPVFESITVPWWSYILLFVAGASALILQYALLRPRHQFLPPRLSIKEIEEMIAEEGGKVPGTPGEMAGGGAIIGGLGAVLLVPEPISMITGILLGLLFGLGGTALEDTKREKYEAIMREFNVGMQQLSDRICRWAERSREEMFCAVFDSFKENCMKVDKQLTYQRLLTYRAS
jgi:hypothetical protein